MSFQFKVKSNTIPWGCISPSYTTSAAVYFTRMTATEDDRQNLSLLVRQCIAAISNAVQEQEFTANAVYRDIRGSIKNTISSLTSEFERTMLTQRMAMIDETINNRIADAQAIQIRNYEINKSATNSSSQINPTLLDSDSDSYSYSDDGDAMVINDTKNNPKFQKPNI